MKTKGAFDWLFIVGMPRSASTWCYNVCRLILEQARSGTACGYVGEGSSVDDFIAEHDAKDESCPRLLKLHQPTAGVLDRLNVGSASALYSQRDIRDVAASMMEFENLGFDDLVVGGQLDNIMKNHELWTNAPGTLQVRYADIMSKPLEVITDIGTFVGFVNINKLATEIAEACSLEQARENVRRLATARPEAANGSSPDIRPVTEDFSRYYDAKTLLHANHVASGETGRFQYMLSRDNIRFLEDTYPQLFFDGSQGREGH